MQVKFPPPSTTGLGRFCGSRSSTREARRDGLNASLSNHGDADSGGLGNEATPSEGAKRRYPAHFLSKLTDADGELQETLHWLGRAGKYGYLEKTKRVELEELCLTIGRKLGKMLQIPESFS